MEIAFLTLGRLGLFLNVVASVMVAISFGRNLEEAYQVDKKGRKVYLASLLHPKLLTWGLIIIILGFVLQFIA